MLHRTECTVPADDPNEFALGCDDAHEGQWSMAYLLLSSRENVCQHRAGRYHSRLKELGHIDLVRELSSEPACVFSSLVAPMPISPFERSCEVLMS